MKQEQHTPEPWSYTSTESMADGETDAFVVQSETGPNVDVAEVVLLGDEGEADARRIVACVNACQGVPTEALEAGAVAELLAACRSLLELAENAENYLPSIPEVRETISQGQAAIAKATGGD